MPVFRPQIFSPDDVVNPGQGSGLRWDDYPTRFLAQGDSWFSFGAMPPWATTNILQALELDRSASIVNCASPGQRLPRMVDWKRNRNFRRLLTERFGYKWDGLLLSAGGNDLIAAAAVLPAQNDGTPVPPGERLLLKPEEWDGQATGAARYLSEAGWKTFSDHLVPQFGELISFRDAEINRDVPAFFHTYAYPMPRNAPACKRPRLGPWLYPSVVAYGIPEQDWLDVATLLMSRLADLVRKALADLSRNGCKSIYLVETEHALTAAAAGTTGESNDWENEIHPSRGGYAKLAALWAPAISGALPQLS